MITASNRRLMIYSMFEAIREAVDEFKVEADRVESLTTCTKSIVTGELQKLLDNTRHSTYLLKKIHGRIDKAA